MHFYSSTTLVTFLAISYAALLNAAPKSHHNPKHKSSHPTTTSKHTSSHHTTTSNHTSSHHTITSKHKSPHHTTTSEHNSSHHTTTSKHKSSHPTTTSKHSSSNHTTTSKHTSSHHTITSKHSSSHHTTTSKHNSSNHTTTSKHKSSHHTTTSKHTSSHPTTTREHTSSHPTTTPEPGSSHGPTSGNSAWQPDFSKSKASEIIGPIVKGTKARVDQMVKVGSNKEIVFNFAKGSRGANGPGAVSVYSGPSSGSGDFGQKATLTYKVKFQEGFQWNKGGKLHGLYGGNLKCSCSGGKFSDDCFSSRIMWRADGAGEAYIYLPNMPDQVKYYCAKNQSQCTKGMSLERGSFKFIAGQEHTIKMTVGLNTPNARDGTLVVNFDGQDVINRKDIKWTVKDGVKISALFFNSFFGGGDDTWASPQDQSITFTDMSITAN